MGIISEEKDSNGMSRPDSLDNPESLCTVNVWLIPQWRTDFGNGEVLFTNRSSGDAARFILDKAMALGARPIETTNLPTIRGQWRYLEDRGFVVLRLPSEGSLELQSFLFQAFGQPAEQPLKGMRHILLCRGAETNGFELTFQHCPEYAQVRMSRMQATSEAFTNAAVGPERRR